MTRIQALSVSMGLLQEAARYGNDECAEAHSVLDGMFRSLARSRARRRMGYSIPDMSGHPPQQTVSGLKPPPWSTEQ